MKSLSKDKVLRWVSGQQSQGGSGGGGVSVDLAGYATQIWTEQNYVNKEFFSSLFKAYDADGNEVLPNDTETTIDNIKAMFGFWTDFYISALGNGGQQSVDLRLAQLADVNVAGVTNGQVLTYNAATGKWIASTPQSGTDMATIWENLAASGNQQIDASHISTALNGYATQTWVNTQINDMATQTWVGQSYLSKNDATSTYLSKTDAASTYLSIAFFNRLFKAYNGTTQVNPNDTETAIDNIKAMFGFWTDFYISALGTGGQQSVDLRLAQLADVNVAGVTNGQVLTYNAGMWIASTPQSGTDMATVWSALAASDSNHQIDYSHLLGAISINNGTITIGSQSITPVSGNFLPLTGGTMTGRIYLPLGQKLQWTSNDADVNSYGTNWYGLGGYQVVHSGMNVEMLALSNHWGINLIAKDDSSVYVNGNTIVHSGNIGSQSVNYANSADSATSAGSASRLDYLGTGVNNVTAYQTPDSFMGRSGWGSYLIFNHGDGATYYSQTICMPFWGSPLYRRLEEGTDQGWKAFITEENIASQSVNYANSAGSAGYATSAGSADYAPNAGYASSAGRLRGDSSYTAWGQTFWSYGTPNSISGAMSSVTNIDAIAYFDTSNSRLGIGTNTPSNTLHVNGTARVSSLYIGNILITADSSGIYVSNGGLSANTYVTALGQGSQSSSIYLSQLGDVNTSGASNGQALVYRGGTWVPETISSGVGGSYLPLSGGTMTGTIVTPDNNNEGIIPALNNYGQVGSSSRYFYRMYATTFYGTTFVGNLSGTAASASALTNAGRATLISSNNEFNFLSASSSVTSLHFNYKSASGGNTSTAVAEYVFDNGQGTTLAYLNSTGAHAGSDIRRKNIKEYFALAVDDIADAPVIKYTWKDIDDGLHAGSVAQYWQQVLPECVGKHGSSEYLSMNYADIALVSVISLAREVVRLRKEIENLTHNKA